ncbi:hypothetical protein GCM10010211_56280 [Streptomyces albospinus]|uniref:DUF397 domain-containing protein n=1 Tax=Streptomyces albospinus TaxID=285515 RepID=A0ABQ2VEJ1_9ACTN|nr:DUF397 domain-containing protein [Streptomyces albospinus]GGU83061.1 hypothetical protein GCM10010211_56280 [Streptomyces albospinus]
MSQTPPPPNWHKSSYSGGVGNDCVEVADNQPHVLIRDSKLSDGPVVEMTRSAWSAFIGTVAK